MNELATTTASKALDLLGGLKHSSALTAFQAEWLAKHWDELPDDWGSHPYCQQVREHTRAYVDRLMSCVKEVPR